MSTDAAALSPDDPAGIYGSFAARMMAKQGWQQGSGLGKTQQGMTTAIKPSLKFDTTGMGHDPAEEFKDQWWERAFNSAAQTISIEEQANGGVSVTKQERTLEQKERDQKIERGNFYKKFVSSATLNGGQLIEKDSTPKKRKISSDSDSDSSSDYDSDAAGLGAEKKKKMKKPISEMTDDELFAACGGLTAHKGARHGHQMNGKLARIEAADKQWKTQRDPKWDEYFNKEKKAYQEAEKKEQQGLERAEAEKKERKRKKKAAKAKEDKPANVEEDPAQRKARKAAKKARKEQRKHDKAVATLERSREAKLSNGGEVSEKALKKAKKAALKANGELMQARITENLASEEASKKAKKVAKKAKKEAAVAKEAAMGKEAAELARKATELAQQATDLAKETEKKKKKKKSKRKSGAAEQAQEETKSKKKKDKKDKKKKKKDSAE